MSATVIVGEHRRGRQDCGGRAGVPPDLNSFAGARIPSGRVGESDRVLVGGNR
jgi:hypothetical protein